MQDYSLTDPSAREAAKTERPPESKGRTLWADARHGLWLLGQYAKRQPLTAFGLFGFILASSFVSTWLGVQSQVALAALTNALVAKNAALVPSLIGKVLVFGLTPVVILVLSAWAGLSLRMRFRADLSPRLVERWLDGDRYFHLERKAPLDYPEQRIQEDVFLFAERTVTIVPSLIGSVFSIFLYTGQLWKVSPPMTLDAIGVHHPIAGVFVYMAFALGILATLLTHWLGASLTRVEVVRQHLEAQFRAEMAAVRQNGEAIALVRGGPTERLRLFETFDLIRRNWRAYTWSMLKVRFMSDLPHRILLVAPTLMLAPFILRGERQVGDIILMAAAFGKVLDGVSAIVSYYGELAILRSSAARLRLLDEQLAAQITSQLDVAEEARGDIVTRNLKIAFPDGQPMNQIGDLTITRGERLLIQGRSGAGKSTLLRAIAGLWPFGGGAVRLPKDAKIAFLPQRPYMPDGTLASLMSYPQLPSVHDDAAYLALLKQLDLGRLAGQLHTFAPWSKALSPGEQQRIAAIRAILAAPDFLFVDEATSALDPQLEAALYALLAERLPNTALISVAHRPAVARYHTTVLKLEGGTAKRTAIDAAPDPALG